MNDDLLGGLFDDPKSNVFIDGDTVKDLDSGESLRIQGVNTPEVSKVTEEGFTPGQVGGRLTSNLVSGLAQDQGFTKAVIPNPEEKTYGRYVGDMINPATGERLSSKLLSSGLSDITLFSDEGQISSALQGRLEQAQRKLEGKENDWDIAAELVRTERNALTDLKAKPMALDEAQYAAAPDLYSAGGVQIRSPLDRTIDNKATNSLKTAFALGVSNIEEGAWGAWDMIGDVFEVDNSGKANVDRIRRAVQGMPELENQVAFDEEGNWTLDSASKVFDFVITNAAMSAPYMVSSIMSVALAPVTYGASLAVPSVVYTGQVYNEQEEKDPVSAIASGTAQGILERLGLKGITKSSTNFLKDTAVRTKVTNELAKAKFNGNVQAAQKALATETIKELTKLSKTAKDALAVEFRGKYLSLPRGAGQAALKGTASEAFTETGQELLASLGEKNFNLEDIDTDELTNRLINAAVAGGTLGGTLSATGQIKSNLTSLSALSAQSQADLSKSTDDFKYRNDLINSGATEEQLSIDYVASNTNEDISLEDLAAPEEKAREEGSFLKSITDFSKGGIGQLWRGFSNNLNKRFGAKSDSLRRLFAMVNGNNIFYGGGIEDSQHLTESSLNNIVGSEQEALGKFKVKSLNDITNIFSDNRIIDLFNDLSSAYKSGKYISFAQAFNEKGFDLPSEYKNNKDAILEYAQRFYDYNNKIEQITGESKNILEQKTFNKVQIAKNMGEFVEALQDSGMSAKDAETLAFDILDIENIQEATDLFDTNLFDSPVDKSQVDINKLRKNAKLKPFLNDDIFYNISAINGSTAARLANAKFLGKDGNKLAYYIKQALDAGEITEAEAAYIAAEMRDYIKIRKGEYKRIESPGWRAFQQNALFLSTLNQLSLATVSSLVELGLVSNGLNKKVIFDKGFIKDAAKDAARETYDLFNEGAFRASRGRIKRADLISDDKRRNDLYQLGFMQESQSVAQKNDVNAGVSKQRAINSFFKIIGLQSLTNFTRNARLALAGDAILGWVYDVSSEGSTVTKQSLEARENLISLGIDVQFMINYENNMDPTPEEQAKYDEQMRLGSFRFVNQAVAHPTKSNRPKFYQNPRTALFFQFQGFISTFTATILPRIYRSLFNSNTPLDTRLSTAGTLATLLAVGFFSQFLRDLLKYGEETPYLDDFEKFQRAVGASGILGSGERVLNTMFPLYDTRSDGWLDLALDEISGQAPVLGYGGKVTTAVEAIFTGADNAPSRIQKAAPMVGPINQLGWELDDIF